MLASQFTKLSAFRRQCRWSRLRDLILQHLWRAGYTSNFDDADVQSAVEIAYDHVFDLPRESGDVALIDNYRVMHGRRPFSGQRSVLASLCLDSASA